MKTVCEKDTCTGCMACAEACPKHAIHIEGTTETYNAVIDETLCVACERCHKICQNCQKVSMQKPILWQQGWAIDEEVRRRASSGGLATAIAKAFVQAGGSVCSCAFSEGVFRFVFADEENEVDRFTGSKYVKSAPLGIYCELKTRLMAGQRVLLIGLPCQVAAAKLFVGGAAQKNLYTIDLICHGTPSQALLHSFLSQYDKNTAQIGNLTFRNKNHFALERFGKPIADKYASDRYTIAFLQGLTYTENCYRCQYAREERVSDLTLGDAWGTELPQQERLRGISLALSQNEKGIELLSMARLYLVDVNRERMMQNNHQLEQPSRKPAVRVRFFHLLGKGKTFNRAVFKCYPKQCMKQKFKSGLYSIKSVFGRGEKNVYGGKSAE